MKNIAAKFSFLFIFLLFTAGWANAGTFVVNSTLGTVGAAGAGTQTMRWAVIQCNAAPAGPHTILFDDALIGLQCLSVISTDLTASNVTVDGTTMTGYTCGNPMVSLNCDGFNGWEIKGANNTVRGLRIRGGINYTGTGSNNKIFGCLFNIDFAGAAWTTAAKAAMRTNAANTDHIWGGFTDCDRNVMAAEGSSAVVFDAGGGGTQVLGNYMGTGITGLTPLGAGFGTRCITLGGGSNIIIDGNTMGKVLGSSQGQGIQIDAGTAHTIINNNIGANANRLFMANFTFPGCMAVMFNAGAGANSTFSNNVVGNTTFLTNAGINGNVITVEGSNGLTISGNYIGCDIAFNAGGSSWAGLYLYSGVVGATVTGNYIGFNGRTSAQRSHGLALFNVSGALTISGNYIGVTPTGGDMGNGDAGIEVNTGVTNPTITGNYIGFNKCMRFTNPGTLTSDGGGIRIIAGESVIIEGNYIGTLPGGRLPNGNIADCGNSRAGIGIEGNTTTKIDILNNVIAYNKTNGVHSYNAGKGTPDKIKISQNCMFCNTWDGIELSGNGAIGNNAIGRNYGPITHDGLAKQGVLVNANTHPTWASNFLGDPWIIRGFAMPGSTVELFQSHHCSCLNTLAFSTIAEGTTGSSAGGQGLDYLASVTTAADGTWSINIPANTVKTGLTATATNVPNNRTTEFSPCLAVTPTCLPPVSTTSSTPTLTPCALDPFTTTGSSTLVRASCYNNIYYSWLKDGVVISGPTLAPFGSNPITNLSYTDPSGADPADDGNYVLRVEDGNAGSAPCYLQAAPLAIDVINCAPTAIKLIYFRGEAKADNNELSWLIETDEFGTVEVQKSLDGKSFTAIDNRYFSSGLIQDNIIDPASTMPVVYYRLKVMPSETNEYYSKVIAINKNTSLQVNILQSKADDWLDLEVVSSTEESVNYTIYDIRGVAVGGGVLEVLSGVSSRRIYVGNLASAVYIIKCEGLKYGNTDREKFLR